MAVGHYPAWPLAMPPMAFGHAPNGLWPWLMMGGPSALFVGWGCMLRPWPLAMVDEGRAFSPFCGGEPKMQRRFLSVSRNGVVHCKKIIRKKRRKIALPDALHLSGVNNSSASNLCKTHHDTFR